MAPRQASNKRKTAKFYASNSDSYKKKLEYDKKYNATKKRRKYRADLARERTARGIMGKGGNDVSHTVNGGYKLENPSRNRARNGHGNNARLAPGRGTRRAKRRR